MSGAQWYGQDKRYKHGKDQNFYLGPLNLLFPLSSIVLRQVSSQIALQSQVASHLLPEACSIPYPVLYSFQQSSLAEVVLFTYLSTCFSTTSRCKFHESKGCHLFLFVAIFLWPRTVPSCNRCSLNICGLNE